MVSVRHQQAPWCIHLPVRRPKPKAAGSELEAKWAVGTKLYHDDYGYGVIVSARMNGSDYIIEVQFETGAVKKFLPEYQAKSLQIIK